MRKISGRKGEMRVEKPQVLCIKGPTASGKTALSVALAQQMDGEVVSADSMQIYREMNIGTAKPDEAERQGVPHHMLDVADAGEDYSAARYAEEASACVDDILRRGKLPIIAGGTGLYLDALIKGIDFAKKETDGALRAELTREAETPEGMDRLIECLRQVDPESAARLHRNDKKRVIRALEIYRLTGQTMTEHDRESRVRPPRYRAVSIALTAEPRALLYRRIDQRVEKMVAAGLYEEAKGLWERGLFAGTAGQAIGYKEWVPCFEGKETKEQAAEAIRQNTRRYAKRQLTWLRREEALYWIQFNREEDFREVCALSRGFAKRCGVK